LRADRWREAFGVEQTEIDALATLRPELLRQLARDAIAPFYDTSLDGRVLRTRHQWERAAQDIIDNNIDQDHLARLRSDFEAKLDELQSEIDAITNALRIDISDFDLPPIPEVPQPDVTHYASHPEPLVDSSWSFAEQCRRLVESKRYGGAP
jgi:hypothetical protein